LKFLIRNLKIILFVLFIFIVLFVYFLMSYKGFWIFETGFNELDYLIFNLIGDAFLVGIVTYISTKSISFLISKKEFARSNKLDVNVVEKNHALYNFIEFIESYGNSNCYFGLSNEDRKVVEYVYKKYQIFDVVLNKAYLDDRELENIMNFPFVSNYIVKGTFVDNWKKMFKELAVGKSKENIKLLKCLISDKDYIYFERFSVIIGKIKFFEIVNINSNSGCTLLVTANDMVINKISCLPNSTYKLYVYFDDEKWIQFIGFSYDYDGKSEATNLVGFKYSNELIDFKPAHIDLSKYIKVNKV